MNQLAWAKVTKQLFQEEARLSRLEQRLEALNTSVRGKRHPDTSSAPNIRATDSQDNLLCTYCGKRRHLEEKCFKKQRDLRMQKAAKNTKSARNALTTANHVQGAQSSDYESAEEEF